MKIGREGEVEALEADSSDAHTDNRGDLNSGDYIYAQILEDIGNGTFPSGTRLKAQALAQRYGTSTSPVREALRLLQGEGIVSYEPNRGATVEQIDVSTLRDIFEVLQLLEPYFVAWFAENCREEDIDELEEIQSRLEGIPVTDKRTFGECDKNFHERIAQIHHNQRARDIWFLQKRILNALALRLPIGPARHEAIMAEHKALIEAFRKHDVETALVTIRKHVTGAGEQMYTQLRALQAREGRS